MSGVALNMELREEEDDDTMDQFRAEASRVLKLCRASRGTDSLRLRKMFDKDTIRIDSFVQVLWARVTCFQDFLRFSLY